MESKVKGMAACEVCGRGFPLIAEEVYVARDVERSGIAAVVVGEVESAWYDAIDCPHCGCQNVLQERKRPLAPGDLGDEESTEGGCGCEGDDDGE